MPSNSEMYERGALDAHHDELNPFYYQHYYYYRRGYDEARRRARASGRSPLPVVLAVALALAVLGGAWWYLGQGRAPTQPAAQVATAPPASAPPARPTARPTALPSATAVPTAAPALAVGARARVVNLNGAPLRAREAPGLSARVVARIPEGAEVTLRDGPVAADGYTWWQVEAEGAVGWVAGRSPEGALFLEVGS